ncbi:MAG: YsnF/AvaK domain-containing protein [Armatimonadota bacterium]|nr:YsnF/AvaK domain-containing protein [Armatimonadota bacterium]
MTTVTLADGEQAVLEPNSRFRVPGKVVVRLATGRQVIVPESALISAEGGGYRLPFASGELTMGGKFRVIETSAETEAQEETIMPIVAETLRVTKETVVTGGVRLTKQVTEHEETVDEALLREDVQVERVPINQMVAEAPQMRQEGDTLIVPILEEVLVVEKHLLLKEEVRITRTRTEVHQPQAVTLRSEEAVIEEISPETPLRD